MIKTPSSKGDGVFFVTQELYRGSDFALPERVENQFYSKCNRTPRNTPDRLHQAADEWFFSKFGIRFRGGSVFCTGNFDDAKIYGAVYRVRPVTNFHACFSLKVSDLYDTFYDQNLHVGNFVKEEFFSFMDSLEYECTSCLDRLSEAAKANVEIMLYCEAYYAEKW